MNELTEAKNKIKELEEKLSHIKNQLKQANYLIKEKEAFISDIEKNSRLDWVEGWKDADGNKFYGNISWVKSDGTLDYSDASKFEGEWLLNGEFYQGELIDRSRKVIEKWEDGEFIDGEFDGEN
jgi:hypothetical protein